MFDRQWNEEEKSRKKISSEHEHLVDDDGSDGASTKDGVLHEESFVEHNEPAVAHDVEAPVVSEDQGILSTLKVVNWWQVSLCLSSLEKEKKSLRREAFRPCCEAWLMGGIGSTEGGPSLQTCLPQRSDLACCSNHVRACMTTCS